MEGYDPHFLGPDMPVAMPKFSRRVASDVLSGDELREGYIADYQHYSVVMSKKNCQAYLSICNLDQMQYRTVSGRTWFIDDRIGEQYQMDNRYYKGEDNYWDRGHLTRRTAVTWGESDQIARRASNDSCSYANACLQHRNFNQDEWRVPEELAHKFERDMNGRLCIATGPLFTHSDRWFDPSDFDVTPGRIPSGFWKIIYYVDKKKTEAAGEAVLGCEAYLIDHDEASMVDRSGGRQMDIVTYQVTITELSELTGIEFPEELFHANPLWYYPSDERGITEPERYEIKVAGKSEGVRDEWPGHVIHDREDIDKHCFKRVSQ